MFSGRDFWEGGPRPIVKGYPRDQEPEQRWVQLEF